MSDMTHFERRLAATMQRYAGPRRSVDGEAVARAAAAVPPPRRLAGPWLRQLPDEWHVPWRLVGAIGAAGALFAAGILVGSQRPAPPAPRGLVAYAMDGDIYVGDLGTGETSAVVTGPQRDSTPKFSPDGSLIAFVRGSPWNEDATIVVARTDGSDERVVMPAGFSRRGVSFAWTPDSASLVVNHDGLPFRTPYYDGELSLFDAAGISEPRLITPPLANGVGGDYFGAARQVAPMFRPPAGDLILGTGPLGELYAWNRDFESYTQLGAESLREFEPYTVGSFDLGWSADGSQIRFTLMRSERWLGSFVMNADGTNVRQLPLMDGGTWSVDGTKLASERCSSDPEGGAVIVIHDVVSGTERVLGATAVRSKTEGVVPRRPISIPPPADQTYCGWFTGEFGRNWDYEGWSWTPDSTGIVWLETRGERPKIVDVESGRVSELPWEMDSPPSWRLVPVR